MTTTITIPEPETNDLAIERLLTRRGWALDLAWVGGASALAVATMLGASALFALAVAATSALIGAAIGAGAPWLLSRRVRRLPVLVLLGAGAGLGANWGALSAASVALASDGGLGWVRAAELGGTAGLLVMGLFWLPAALLRASGRSTRLARIAALALSPVIAGYLLVAL
ncbi:hypothetical protein [Sandaracinus amylolyticus]|uniref:Uncharacterized protein n=1 Tax=Sandaracinus amylolyticus TaxID=927083 RepID=A0A0F6W8C3_9BACT|nr:hypothetical protein [Sandaracinus amylolyticus]AKF09992.1 hypothetical protein DB32_007141 [Sandaracinus amylolyticus]